MVTIVPELLQPISWSLHACHGCYNQICGCNNLKSNGYFNQVDCFQPRNIRRYRACQFQGYFDQAVFCMGHHCLQIL